MIDISNMSQQLADLKITCFESYSRDERLVSYTLLIDTLMKQLAQDGKESHAACFALLAIDALLQENLELKRSVLERSLQPTPLGE